MRHIILLNQVELLAAILCANLNAVAAIVVTGRVLSPRQTEMRDTLIKRREVAAEIWGGSGRQEERHQPPTTLT
jgi:hypothetical protein